MTEERKEGYKNIALVTWILGGFIVFIIVTTVWVVYDVTQGRSCVRTRDHNKNFTQKR